MGRSFSLYSDDQYPTGYPRTLSGLISEYRDKNIPNQRKQIKDLFLLDSVLSMNLGAGNIDGSTLDGLIKRVKGKV